VVLAFVHEAIHDDLAFVGSHLDLSWRSKDIGVEIVVRSAQELVGNSEVGKHLIVKAVLGLCIAGEAVDRAMCLLLTGYSFKQSTSKTNISISWNGKINTFFPNTRL
jgi:hypothetical protein